MEIDLKQKQIHQLLKIQQLFHSHYLTEELLNQMITLYVKFVQNINSNQHPIRLYFMEKIKFVLSRPQVIRILEKDTITKSKSIRETVRGVMGVSQADEMEMKRIAEQAKAEVRKNHVINMKKQKANVNDLGLKEKERNMKIEMQLKIMQEVESNMVKFRNDFNKKDKQNHIDKIVNEQDKALNQRLANRKKRQRKKSADLKEEAAAPPIKIEQLKLIQQVVQLTYERFTRLTQHKITRIGTNGQKENEGRVKFQTTHSFEAEEDYFSEPKVEEKKNFTKKKSKEAQIEAKVLPSPLSTTEHKQGRVTVRNAKYEQIEQEQF